MSHVSCFAASHATTTGHVTLTVATGTTILVLLWPCDAIWRHGSGSTLAQVMACCLTAPSHYLNQCWLIVNKVQWHSSERNFTKVTSATNLWISLKTYLCKISFKSPRGQWVKSYHCNSLASDFQTTHGFRDSRWRLDFMTGYQDNNPSNHRQATCLIKIWRWDRGQEHEGGVGWGGGGCPSDIKTSSYQLGYMGIVLQYVRVSYQYWNSHYKTISSL